MRRLSSVVLVAALLAAPMSPSVAAAGQQPQIPQSQAEWDAMSPREQAVVLAMLAEQRDRDLQDGTATIQVVPGEIESAASRGAAIAAASVSAQCGIGLIIYSYGEWVRGGGYTTASDYIYRIYASRPGKQGQLFRDGVLKENWYDENYNASHAEDWTGWHWIYWFESAHWVAKGWHGAYNSGRWLLGPDAPCTANYYT